jgi:hypothetical protein
MSNTIRTISSIDNIVNNARAYGSLPQRTENVVTYSSKMHQTVQVVGTTEELLSVGDVPDDAMCVIRNMHATAQVSVGVVVSGTFYPLVVIPAGEESKLSRLEAVASTYLKSSAVSTEVLVTLFEIDQTE